MSTTVDNITLALVSLQNYLVEYLDANGWRNRYTISLAGDPKLRGKELSASARGNQIQLPLVTLETGQVRGEIEELGSENGRDKVVLSLVIVALDDNQLRTLGNAIRRKVDGLVYSLYDYTTSNKTLVGSGEITDAVFEDLSDWDSPNVATRHLGLINSLLDLPTDSLI